MRDKAKKKPLIDVYRYVMLMIAVFIIFCGFDLLDGDPNGLRGLAEFFRLVAGV